MQSDTVEAPPQLDDTPKAEEVPISDSPAEEADKASAPEVSAELPATSEAIAAQPEVPVETVEPKVTEQA